MKEFDVIPKDDIGCRDETLHHSEWKDLQMKESNREDQTDGNLLELHHIFHISPDFHP